MNSNTQGLVDSLISYFDILDILSQGSVERRELIEQAEPARATVDRELAVFQENQLVEQTEKGYRLTGAGQLIVDSYRSRITATLTGDRLTIVRNREEQLSILTTQPCHKPELVEESTVSRSTIDRAIDELADVGLIEKERRRWRPTSAGEQALEQYRQFVKDVENILSAADLLGAVPQECHLPLSVISEGHLELHADQYQLMKRVVDQVESATRYRAALPRIQDSRHVRLWHSLATRRDVEIEVFSGADTLTNLREEFPYLCTELTESGAFTAYQCDVPEIGLLAFENPAETEGTAELHSVILVVYDQSGIAGFIEADNEDAATWATEFCADLQTEGQTVTVDLQRGNTSLELPPLADEQLPTAVLDAGFRRIDDEYFEQRDPMEATTAWRAGLRLPEIDAGYAVPRHHEDYHSMTEAVSEKLLSGSDIALLGPPGAGKSTVAKQVAYHWYDTDIGTVLYHESGQGQQFESLGMLDKVLDHCGDPVLVVIEEFARADINSLLELVQSYSGDDDIHFLVEARESEWQNTAEMPIDSRMQAFKDNHFEILTLPKIDETDCRRLLNRVEDITGNTISISAEELLADVQTTAYDTSEDTKSATPGLLFLLFHKLTRYLEPLADAGASPIPSTLSEHVDQVRNDLAEIGETALEVGIIVNVLNAAGLDIDPAYLRTPALHSQGSSSASFAGQTYSCPEEVYDALDRLEGDVLFETNEADEYMAIHHTWSVEFLSRMLDAERESRARERFGRCLSSILSLSVDDDDREQIHRMVGETQALEQIMVAPTEWADHMVEQIFTLGRQWPKLGPLFDAAGTSSINVPPTCSDSVQRDVPVWLGRLLLAGSYYDRAEHVFEKLPTEDCRLQNERLLGLGRIAFHRGEHELAQDRLERCVENARAAGEQAITAEALTQLGKICTQQNAYENAREYYQQSLDIYEELDDIRGKADTYTGLGIASQRQSAYEQAIEYYERSLEIARDICNRGKIARSFINLGVVAWHRGELDQAREYFERSLDLYREMGNRKSAGRNLNNLGLVAFNLGEYEQAREYHERSLEITKQIDDKSIESSNYNNLGLIAKKLGEYDTAREYFEKHLEMSRELEDQKGIADALSNLGPLATTSDKTHQYHKESLELRREIGDRKGVATSLRDLGTFASRRSEYDQAREYHRESIEIMRDISNQRGEAICLIALGTVAQRLGEYHQARDCYEQSRDIIRDIGSKELETTALSHLAELAVTYGDCETATEYLEQSKVALQEIDPPIEKAMYQRVRALIARSQGQYEQADTYLTQARELLDPDTNRFQYARTQYAFGKLALARGETTTASDYANRALDLFEKMQATHWVGRTHTMLGEIASHTAADGDPDEHWHTALAIFEELDTPNDALETLQYLFEFARRNGETESAREYLQRACTCCQTAPDATVDRHGDWITDTLQSDWATSQLDADWISRQLDDGSALQPA